MNMNGLTLASVTAGAILICAFPVVLLIFGILMVRASRRGELAGAGSQSGVWLLGIGLASMVLAFTGSVLRLPALNWTAIGLVLMSVALCVRFLLTPLKRPLKLVSRLLLCELLFVVAFGSFAVWIAGRAAQLSAYNNTNEAKVRAAIARNPDDAAAHSSLAHIDHLRRDRAGEMAEWRQVLRVEPDNLDALILLSGKLSYDGRIEEARPLYQRLAARHDQFSANARVWLVQHRAP